MKKMKPNNRQNSEENEDEIDIGILIFLFLTYLKGLKRSIVV